MPKSKPKTKHKCHSTHESTAYLEGLFKEFEEQTLKYNLLTGQLLSVEARIELAEKTLCLTRDHFAMAVSKTQDAALKEWDTVFNSVRFVGVRLVDACGVCLKEHKKMTPEELLRDLNNGMFRFRTNSPLREIHAALIRYPWVNRTGRGYEWVAPPEAEQIPMRLRVVQREMVAPRLSSRKGGATNLINSNVGEGKGETKVM